MVTSLETSSMHQLNLRSFCRFVSCDRGVNLYELDLSDLALRGCSVPIPMFVVSKWDSDTRASLLERVRRLAVKNRLMIVAAGHEHSELHAWKELPASAVYLDHSTLRRMEVDEDPISIVHSHFLDRLGIRPLNPVETPESIDPTALILRDSESNAFREIDAPIITVCGPPFSGKSVFVRQVFPGREAVFVDCREYKCGPEGEDDFARFLGQNLRSPVDVQTINDFTDALIEQSSIVNPVLVLDNSDARNVYTSPMLACLARAASVKPFRMILIGHSNVFQENKWLRPNCKTERFTLPTLTINQVREFIDKLFSSLRIRLVDADRVMTELAAMANGLPGVLTILCNRLINNCITYGRHTLDHIDVFRLK